MTLCISGALAVLSYESDESLKLYFDIILVMADQAEEEHCTTPQTHYTSNGRPS